MASGDGKGGGLEQGVLRKRRTVISADDSPLRGLAKLKATAHSTSSKPFHTLPTPLANTSLHRNEYLNSKAGRAEYGDAAV